VPLLVSCWHCKRAVLIVPRLTERDLAWLCDHLAACEPDDPSIGLGVGAILRHFRLVEIEGEPETDRAALNGGRYAR
jgi:hypothetical protein